MERGIWEDGKQNISMKVVSTVWDYNGSLRVMFTMDNF